MERCDSTGPGVRARRGFTLVEVIVCTVLVGVMMVASLSAAGTAARFRQSATDREFGDALAMDLAEEIASKAFGTTTSGAIAGAIVSGARGALTTIDQYNGLVESPPVSSSGLAIPGGTGWKRTVTVERVSAAAPSTASVADTGVKRVTVVVSRGKTVVASTQFLRTSVWDVARN